jgi:hypothetical protein
LAFLILPPTFMITENPEIPIEVKTRALAYQENLLNQLGVTKAQEQNLITKGGYRGTRIFNWNKSYDAYLPTYFLFPVGIPQKKEYMQTASLVRYKDCLQLGSVWNITDKETAYPLPNSNAQIFQIADRSFPETSPIKINIIDDFRAEERTSNILNIFLGEKFSEKGILNITNLSRIVCKGNFLENLKSPVEVEYPGKAHRLINIKMKSELSQKKINWPIISYGAQINSGVFAEKNKDLLNETTPQLFRPDLIAENIVAKVINEIHDLKLEEFKVIRRYRGWVYLNRGRAFQLAIGTRLIGPENSRLHIIRFSPEVNGEIDSSIAFIRYEDEKRPIIVGDILKIDPTLFPKTKNSANTPSK